MSVTSADILQSSERLEALMVEFGIMQPTPEGQDRLQSPAFQAGLVELTNQTGVSTVSGYQNISGLEQVDTGLLKQVQAGFSKMKETAGPQIDKAMIRIEEKGGGFTTLEVGLMRISGIHSNFISHPQGLSHFISHSDQIAEDLNQVQSAILARPTTVIKPTSSARPLSSEAKVEFDPEAKTALQKFQARLGVEQTGSFDKATQEAFSSETKQLQENLGLEVTGVYDDALHQKIATQIANSPAGLVRDDLSAFYMDMNDVRDAGVFKQMEVSAQVPTDPSFISGTTFAVLNMLDDVFPNLPEMIMQLLEWVMGATGMEVGSGLMAKAQEMPGVAGVLDGVTRYLTQDFNTQSGADKLPPGQRAAPVVRDAALAQEVDVAIRSVQEHHGLDVTGELDKETRMSMASGMEQSMHVKAAMLSEQDIAALGAKIGEEGIKKIQADAGLEQTGELDAETFQAGLRVDIQRIRHTILNGPDNEVQAFIAKQVMEQRDLEIIRNVASKVLEQDEPAGVPTDVAAREQAADMSDPVNVASRQPAPVVRPEEPSHATSP